MANFVEKMDSIKDSILKFVPAKCIYLFGSHIVTPDNINNFSEIYTKINESDAIFSINAVKKVRDFKPISDLRIIANNE